MNVYFENVKKNFGFGAMRLPMQDGEVDIPQTCRMVDAFLDAGFNYFDTAHGYLDGKSELALRECLTSRYPRDRYILTDKLTNFYFKQQEDIRPFFQSQLEVCGVDYFDFYLMHAQSMENFSMFKRCHAYETALELRKLLQDHGLDRERDAVEDGEKYQFFVSDLVTIKELVDPLFDLFDCLHLHHHP